MSESNVFVPKVFYKYPSIENSYRTELIEKINGLHYDKLRYCVTEKIHGANTQIDYNFKTGQFVIGKRTDVLKDGEDFYHSLSVLESFKDKIHDIAMFLQSHLATDEAPLAVIRAYGELFGGSYPHSAVPVNKSANRVQKGVFYSPDNEWAAFDISYSFDAEITGDDGIYFMNGRDFRSVCERFALPVVPLLAVTDNLSDALVYPNDGLSEVYSMFGLPPLEHNVMEGVVIRPWDVDVWMGMTRLVLKNKNQKFAEKKQERKVVSDSVELSESVKHAFSEISAYITANRVQNVLSHYGDFTEKDIGKLIGLCCQDALADYRKESKTLDFMDKSEEKLVTKQLTRMMAPVVRKVVLGY